MPFKTLLAEYFKTQHSFGHPVLTQQKQLPATYLDLLLETFKQAKRKLSEAYGLDLDSIIFSSAFRPNPNVNANLHLNSILTVAYCRTFSFQTDPVSIDSQ